MNIKFTISRVRIFALLFALCPFLMNYKLPIVQINFTVGLFMAVFVCEFIGVMFNPKKLLFRNFYGKKLFWITFAFILFNHFHVFYRSHPENYKMSAVVDMFLLFVELLGIILFFQNKTAVERFRTYTENVAFIMAIVVILECAVWYGLGMYPAGGNHQLTLPFLSVDSYDNLSKIVSPTGLFRPSAFFLEPAHFSNYCIIALASLLFPNVEHPFNVKTITISIAMLLTLSGFGIMLVAMVWGIYLVMGDGGFKTKHLGRNFMLMISAITTMLILYSASPSFRSAVARFTGAEGDNAVYGRLGNYYLFIEKLEGFSRTWGLGYRNLPLRKNSEVTHYFTGILELMYCQGNVGAVIFSVLYILMILKIYREKNMLAFTISAISLVFIVGSASLSASGLLIYIPFLFAMDYCRNPGLKHKTGIH